MQSLEFLKSALTISASGVTAAAVLNHFATRRRNRRVEKVSHLVRVCGPRTKRQAVIGVLRGLEARGFGRFVIGRKGHDSRFVWSEA